MKTRKWRSSGREPFVLKIDEPRNLFGVHADLIQGTLKPAEKVLYLIYSPIWESEKALLEFHKSLASPWQSQKAILETHAYPASHAIAVGENRFIISEDRHLEGVIPTVQTIPFNQVLWVELGSALILGWLVIRHVDQDRLSSTALLYTTSSGKDHFHRAVAEYRKQTRPKDGHRKMKAILRSEIWPKASLLQMERINLLLLREEQAFSLIYSSEIWGQAKRWWRRVPVCLMGKGLFVGTNLGFIYALDEPPMKPGMLSFGINVSCIPLDVIKSATLLERRMGENSLPFMRIEIGRNLTSHSFEIPFIGACLEAADDLARHLNRN